MSKKESKQIPRLFVLNDPTVLRIVPSLAAEIGLNESILLMQIDFLKSVSTAEHHNGRPWTYQSIRDLQEEYFPFWSKDTINRAIASLQAKRLIRCGNFNKAAYDKTRWISINYGKCGRLKSIQVAGGLSQNATRSTQNATRSTQIETTIPETSTETSTENIAAAACMPNTSFGKETKTKVKKTIDLSPIEPVLKILRETDKNADKSISLNLRNMIRDEIEMNGEDYVCAAVRGRVAQAKATGKALWLSTFFDPDRAEWRAECARVGEAAQNAPQRQETASETASAVEAMHELMMSGNVT